MCWARTTSTCWQLKGEPLSRLRNKGAPCSWKAASMKAAILFSALHGTEQRSEAVARGEIHQRHEGVALIFGGINGPGGAGFEPIDARHRMEPVITLLLHELLEVAS